MGFDEGSGWRARSVVERDRLGLRLYAPYGPSIEHPDALADALAALTERARALGCYYIRIEPTGAVSPADLIAAGLAPARSVQPRLTRRIDLSVGAEGVFAQMNSTNRNLFRTMTRKGLAVRRSNDPGEIELFIRLIRAVASRTGLRPHPDDYFRAQAETLMPTGAATLYVVEAGAVPVATALLYDDAGRRYYAHAAADDDFRSLHGGSVLVAQAILDGAEQGQAEFDLYGIAPEGDDKHPWAGFSRFKRSFGGVDHAFVGAWELPVLRTRYAARRALLRVLE